MGTLMRRYWQPIGAASEMRDRWTKPVRLLGESLVLYRDRSGGIRFGSASRVRTVARRCCTAFPNATAFAVRPMVGSSMAPARASISPTSPPRARSKTRSASPAYPVEERGGLLWAYLGPLPAPRVAPLAGLDEPHAIRLLGEARSSRCNWLQIMENSVDAIHTEWLHGHLFEFVLESTATSKPTSRASTSKPRSTNSRTASSSAASSRALPRTATIGRSAIRWSFPALTLLVGSASDTFCHMRAISCASRWTTRTPCISGIM